MPYDVLTFGRVSMDLFSLNIGAPFVEIEGFDTGVGGSPTNIAIGTSRLGLHVGAITAVGDDKVGDFVLHFLEKEQVDTRFIPRKADTRTGLAVLGIEPPDKFPLVFYRDNPADIYLSIDDMQAVPMDEVKVLLLSGTALSQGSCREATLYLIEQSHRTETKSFMDLDLRSDQWSHPLAYGLTLRTVLPKLNVIIGTEEEFYSALAPNPQQVMRGDSISEAERQELERLLQRLLNTSLAIEALVVKRGARGVSIFQPKGEVLDIAGFRVEIINTVGAGDAFASGLIYGYRQDWDWTQTARFANACGALVVTRHGCSKAMPRLNEVEDFLYEQANSGSS